MAYDTRQSQPTNLQTNQTDLPLDCGTPVSVPSGAAVADALEDASAILVRCDQALTELSNMGRQQAGSSEDEVPSAVMELIANELRLAKALTNACIVTTRSSA